MTPDYERLQSLDEEGHRAEFFVAEVTGFWRRHRDWTQFFLIAFFLILPWTTLNGQQTLLLHLARREFVFFGMTFFSHDAPLIFFILATLTIGLAFVTSVWGRVWCGWACPQTVFIDTIYRRIEKWIEGNHLERRKLAKQDLSFKKLCKKFIKWFLFFVVSALIAHSFLAYFVGARDLLEMMGSSPFENWDYFLLVFAMTGLVLFDFGWFREQFCIIMCPYGRFQSVLLDETSMTVYYDDKRGEPRKGTPDTNQKQGDCVSCNRCVQVCPTRIDIRNGLQMECIACTACIDACDEIMRKVNKPEGLIRYAAQDGSRPRFWKPRTLVYLSLITILIGALIWNIVERKNIDVTLLRANESPYTFTKDQQGRDVVLNHFRLHLKNQNAKTMNYKVSLQSADWIQMTLAKNLIILLPHDSQEIHVFLQFPKEKSAIVSAQSVQLSLTNEDNKSD
ncbi:cytochrome c oxidase accessory protein CcoG, partial [bacterium]|nr:cytochrome c oxidase accessory protein CcoG [bacterium]